MQSPFKLTAIVIACALALSACGSSSSGGDDSNVTKNPPETSTPEASTPEASTPEASTPEASTPEESTPEESTPEESTPEESTPEESTPEASTPETGNPETGNPETGTPETDNPEIGNPEIGDPEAGTPLEPGTPKTDTPKTDTPETSVPETTSYVVPAGTAQNSFNVKTSVSYDAANFDKITVDGVEIPLSTAKTKIASGNPSFVKSVYYTDKGESNGTRSSLNFTGANVITSQRTSDSSDASYEFANVVAGAVVAGANQYLFVQGTPTESTAVPTTGKATYNGGFLRFASDISNNLFQTSGAITGNFTADVDFGDKTIEGQIRNGNGAPTTAAQPFKGNVSSNGFTANWTDSDTGSGLKGNFYGSTAEEVGGTFERSDSFGVFVGKK
ncbi:hypothetical protein O1Q80_02091 [Lonepinella sp. MS14435]